VIQPPVSRSQPDFDTPPHRLSGVVYGCLLNHAPALAALGDAVHQPPYKAPPQAPVLYLKPRNTLAADGQAVEVPAGPLSGHTPAGAATDTGAAALQVGAALGLVIGRTACRVSQADALDCVAGAVIVNDLSLPHASFYRPSVRLKARDGFCPIGASVVPLAQLPAPVDALGVRVFVDGVLVHSTTTGDRLRNAARLLADVSDFMTLSPGDVLMLGVSAGAPLARAGQTVAIEIDGLGRLTTPLVPEPASPAALTAPAAATGPQPAATPVVRPVVRPVAAGGGTATRSAAQATARVAYDGAIHTATAHQPNPGAEAADTGAPAQLRLADGRTVAEDQVVWLPPFEAGTVIALGLNYADHVKALSKELTLSAQDEPLVFLKGPGTLIGHRGHTRRPAGVAFMHYECELAVVIGRTAHRVNAADAMAYVAGYTVCNDYAVRDYLENWYRPNLRVKNRDGGTVLGPWLVPAAAVPDPQALALRTRVNGRITQQGHTGQMIHSVPALIEYLSAFMTLRAGDVILTGTPDGVVNVDAGDEVVCEIDGIGSLHNTLVGDSWFGR